MTRLLAGIIIFILLILLLCEFTLPDLAEGLLEKAIAESELDPVKTEAQVYAFPAAKILLGQLDLVVLKFYGLSLQEHVDLSYVELRYPQCRISLDRLKEKGFPFQTAGIIKTKVFLNEENLNNYLQKSGIKGISSPILKLQGNKIQINGKISLLGNPLDVQMWGIFQVINQGDLEFAPIEIRVAGEQIPDQIIAKLAPSLKLHLNLQELPLAFQAKSVNIDRNYLIITGEI